MEVFFVRHGQAEDVALGGRDHDRVLTAKGSAQAGAVGQLLTRLGAVPDLVLTSPRLRAVETAQGVLAGAGVPGKPIVQEWLNFDLRPQTVLDELAALPDELERIVLVGHEPTFSGMAAWLLGAEVGYLQVKKGSVLHFTLSPPSRHGAELKMVVPPQVLLSC